MKKAKTETTGVSVGAIDVAAGGWRASVSVQCLLLGLVPVALERCFWACLW